jgi:hypothetical protein
LAEGETEERGPRLTCLTLVQNSWRGRNIE